MSTAEFPNAITPAQSAACTLEMLQALRELAVARGHDALAQLLAAAVAEARALAREAQAADA